MVFNRMFIGFLAGLCVGVTAYTLLAALTVWILVEHYGNQAFTLSGLFALVIAAVCNIRFGHYLDKFSRKYLILGFYLFNSICLSTALLFDALPIASVIIILTFQLSVNVFYTGHYAIAQHFASTAYHHLNALLEVVGQLSALLASMIIFFGIQRLGITALLWLTFVLFVLATLILSTFCETCLNQNKKENRKAENQSFRWFFSRRIAWLTVLGFCPYLVVMAMNQIQPIYFYQIMELTPDTLALSSMVYVLGTLLGSGLASRAENYRTMIYSMLFLVTIGCIVLAITPIQNMFYLMMFVFGIANSGSRVASGSLIMQRLPNHYIGTYNSLKNSLALMVRLSFLLALNGLFPLFNYAYIVYLLPAMLIYLPVLYSAKHYLQRETSPTQIR